jgi:CheY-like chemotaxis protein
MKRILLVEDEVHKRDEMTQCIQEVYGIAPELVDCVSSAVAKVMAEDFDLIVLDMALSTFGESTEDKNKGHDQAQGGIEVLRALKATNKKTNVVIVTQYPDYYIGTRKVKLKDSAKLVGEKYNQNVVGAVLYHYKSTATLQKVRSILKAVK